MSTVSTKSEISSSDANVNHCVVNVANLEPTGQNRTNTNPQSAHFISTDNNNDTNFNSQICNKATQLHNNNINHHKQQQYQHQQQIDMAKNSDDKICENLKDSLSIDKMCNDQQKQQPRRASNRKQIQAKSTTSNSQVSAGASTNFQQQHQQQQQTSTNIALVHNTTTNPITKTSAPKNTTTNNNSSNANLNGASDNQNNINQHRIAMKNKNDPAKGGAAATASDNAERNKSNQVESSKTADSNNRICNKSDDHVQPDKSDQSCKNQAWPATITITTSSISSSATSSNIHDSSIDSLSSNNSEQPTSTTKTSQTDQQQQQPQASSTDSQVPSQTANNRSVLILREINSETPENLVKDIFNSENCPSEPVHCEYAHNNSWYVTFKNDEDARQALLFIRKYAIEWNNKSIMARIKPKPATIPVNSNQSSSASLGASTINDLQDGTVLVGTNPAISVPMINPVNAAAGGVLLQAPGSMMHVSPHMMSHHHPPPAPPGSHYASYTPMGYYGQPPMVSIWNTGSQSYVDLTEYLKSNGLVPDQAALKQNHNLVMNSNPIRGGSDVSAVSGSHHKPPYTNPNVNPYNSGVQQDGLHSSSRRNANNNNSSSSTAGVDVSAINNSHRNNQGNHSHHHAHHRNNNRYNSASNNSYANSSVSSSSSGTSHPRQRQPQAHSMTNVPKQRANNASGNIASN